MVVGTDGLSVRAPRWSSLADVEAVVLENNVANFVLGKAKVTDKQVNFDELMNSNG